MPFKATSRVNIAGALISIIMVILLLVPQSAHAEQVNGEYTIGFNIMHADKKNASIAEGYWNQPATVHIKDGHIRVQTTINKHAWVTEFAISYKGSMSEVKTISVDEASNARLTEFQVSNFTDLVESNVSVTIDEIDYEHSYTMYFKFKPETLTLIKAEEPQVPAAPAAPAEPVTPAPAQDVKPADQAEEQSGQDSALQVVQSDTDIEASVAKEETAATAEEASSDGGPGDEPSDVAQQVKETSELSASEETAVAITVLSEETVEEAGNGSTIAIIIVIIFVLIAIIAIVVYRARHNKQ